MDRTRHVQVEARADEGDEEKEEDEAYNIDIDWAPVRAVSVIPETSKAVDVVAVDAAEAPAPPRWVPWARGAYDPAVHGCSSGLRKRDPGSVKNRRM
jgi:hypothetical protein